MSLERNQISDLRKNALKKYKEYLDDLDEASIDILYNLVQKGNTLEQWQDYLDKLTNEMGLGSSIDDKSVEEHLQGKHESFMK